VHQHLCPPSLVAALRARSRPPRLRGWTLELPGGRQAPLAAASHDPELRAAAAQADGLELVAVSPPDELGLELLGGTAGDELRRAYHAGVDALPRPLRWALSGLDDPDPVALESLLDRGCVGLQLPAPALADAAGYDRVAPLLAVLEERGRPLFVHPSSAPRSPATPGWWPAVVDEVGQMHAAWYAFRSVGRRRHPTLRVCFAILGGLAPLHGERFSAATGERTVVDERAFLETSSYGPRAIDAVVRVLGIDVLVNGSGHPDARSADLGLGSAARVALCDANPIRLFDLREVSDDHAVAAGAQS
jgi:hypothetical protein